MSMEDLKALTECAECTWDYIDRLRMALAAACKERDELKKRLSAYEDTGLEPEEIERIVYAYGRGHTLRTESAERLEIVREIKTDRLRELAKAEKAGRLVVLPCKVGDTVWYITPSTEICEAQVIGIWLNVYTNPQMWLEIKYYSKFTGECEHKSRIDLMLDKTVFLTREEAEAALKGGEG